MINDEQGNSGFHGGFAGSNPCDRSIAEFGERGHSLAAFDDSGTGYGGCCVVEGFGIGQQLPTQAGLSNAGGYGGTENRSRDSASISEGGMIIRFFKMLFHIQEPVSEYEPERRKLPRNKVDELSRNLDDEFNQTIRILHKAAKDDSA